MVTYLRKTVAIPRFLWKGLHVSLYKELHRIWVWGMVFFFVVPSNIKIKREIMRIKGIRLTNTGSSREQLLRKTSEKLLRMGVGYGNDFND